MTCYDPKQFRQEMMERGLYKEEVVYRTYAEAGFEPCVCGGHEIRFDIFYERDFDDSPWLVDYVVCQCQQCNRPALAPNMEALAAKWEKYILKAKKRQEAKARRKK